MQDLLADGESAYSTLLIEYSSGGGRAPEGERDRENQCYIYPATVLDEVRRRTIPRASKRKPRAYYDWGQRPYVPHLLRPAVAALTGGDTSNGV